MNLQTFPLIYVLILVVYIWVLYGTSLFQETHDYLSQFDAQLHSAFSFCVAFFVYAGRTLANAIQGDGYSYKGYYSTVAYVKNNYVPASAFEGMTIGPVTTLFLLLTGFHTTAWLYTFYDYLIDYAKTFGTRSHNKDTSRVQSTLAQLGNLVSKHKLHQAKEDALLSTFKDLLPTVLMNQAQLVLFSLLVFAVRPISTQRETPPLYSFFGGVIACLLCIDVAFYTTHRALHINTLYRWHKKHHETFATVALSGFYQSQLDQFLTSSFTNNFACLLMGKYLHCSSLSLVALIGGVNIAHSHSSFRFPGMPSAEDHYLHHTQRSVNLGLGLLDWYFGTEAVTASKGQSSHLSSSLSSPPHSLNGKLRRGKRN